MNGTLLRVTQQAVVCFVLCVLIKIPCLITTFRRQILFTRRLSRSGARAETARNNNVYSRRTSASRGSGSGIAVVVVVRFSKTISK